MFRIGLLFVLMTLGVYGYAADNRGAEVSGALLQAKISAAPVEPTNGVPGKIQPGTRMRVTAVVKNVGDQPNAPGKLFVRYAFPKPLENHEESLIYQSETVPLPAIEPGDKLTINFTTPHQWPSLFDFIRHDWAMREYEAVVVLGTREQIIGSMAIAFSAYYYEGPSREKAARVSTTSKVRPQPDYSYQQQTGPTRRYSSQ